MHGRHIYDTQTEDFHKTRNARTAHSKTRTHGRVHARTYARTLIHHTVSISGLTACSYVHMRVICVCSTLCIVTAMRYGAALELLRVAVPT